MSQPPQTLIINQNALLIAIEVMPPQSLRAYVGISAAHHELQKCALAAAAQQIVKLFDHGQTAAELLDASARFIRENGSALGELERRTPGGIIVPGSTH